MNEKPNNVKIGMGATLILPEDRYPYVVIDKTLSGKTVSLKELLPIDHEPKHTHNGFPVFDHTYTKDELRTMRNHRKPAISARYHADGYYYSGELQFSIGAARYYRDYSS